MLLLIILSSWINTLSSSIGHIVGVPMPVVQMKCSAAGLDASLLENPDAVVPTSTSPPVPAQTDSVSETEASQDHGAEPTEASTLSSAAGGIKASEHPDYQPFFKMLKVGVPMPVVQMKCSAAGLDGNLIDNPDTIVA